MTIDYYISCQNRIYKKSINTNSEYYISHTDDSATIKEENYYFITSKNPWISTYPRKFETAKELTIARLELKLNDIKLDLTDLKNSTKAYNES